MHMIDITFDETPDSSFKQARGPHKEVASWFFSTWEPMAEGSLSRMDEGITLAWIQTPKETGDAV